MYKYITVAKGIGIILVIMGHFTSSLYMPTYYTEMKTWIFSFHMPLFMLLAGFLFQLSISKKEENYSIKSFVYKKFRRLMIPYFFISFAIAGLNLVLGQFVTVKRTVDWHYLTEIFYTNVGGSAVFLWFMYSLFVIFIIAVLFSQLKHGFIWMGLCSLSLFFIPLPNVFYLSAVHSYLFYFWCGCCLFVLQKKQLLRLSLKELLCSAVVFALFYGTYHTMGHVGTLLTVEKLICGVAGSFLIICLSRKMLDSENRFTRWITIIGEYSAYIYLLHMIGVYLSRILFERIAIFTPAAYFLALCLAVVLGVLIPMGLTKQLIYRNKYLMLLMGGK